MSDNNYYCAASKRATTPEQEHPLYPVLMGCINQAMHGKGKRHGSNRKKYWFYSMGRR